MNAGENYASSHLTLIDAVETLSSIADLELDRGIGVAQRHHLVIQNKPINYRTVHWLHHRDGGSTITLVRDIFRVVLNYLRNYYKKEYADITNKQAIDDIKSIMVLVGEAGSKLDKYTEIFHQKRSSIAEIKEFKLLQDFYLSRIARKIDEGTLGKWVSAISHRTIPTKLKLSGKKSLTKHVFVDLESVRRDTEYELFFLSKEDGSRFFSPRLIRNIKLICDFEEYFGKSKEQDPLRNVKLWLDEWLHASANSLKHVLDAQIEQFYIEGMRFKDRELVPILNKAFMALQLACNPNNLLKNDPIKPCYEYFDDFTVFLRQALNSRDYQNLLALPPLKASKLTQCLLETIHTICRGLFLQLQGMQALFGVVQEIVRYANKEKSTEVLQSEASSANFLWRRLNNDYAALAQLLKRHPNGPVGNVLRLLQETSHQAFDPLKLHNLSNQLYALYLNESKIINLRIPCPTIQEHIHKCQVSDEFKGFLRAKVLDSHSQPQPHLLINLQNRTSWKEHSRCVALEELSSQPEFSKQICVVTLAKNTEFYNQLAPYHQENHANIFMQHFKENLKEEGAGFFFSKEIKNELLLHFVDDAIDSIHRIFFSSKNVMSREQRLDFIEIFYFFLQLKLIDMVKPDSFSLTCKDSIDFGEAAAAQFYAFLKLLTQEKISDVDVDQLNFMLYAPALVLRERLILAEPFNRMISALRTFEAVRGEYGWQVFHKIVHKTFGRYYKFPVLEAKISIPKGIRMKDSHS